MLERSATGSTRSSEQHLRLRTNKPPTRSSNKASCSSAAPEDIAAAVSSPTPSDEDDNVQMSIDPNFEGYHTREEKKVQFITDYVVSTIDAIGISDYKALRLIAAVAQALGYNLNDLNLSLSTIRRLRAANRTLIAETLKKEFKVKFGVVHWDAKLMDDLAGYEKFQRLPIIISQREGVQLLGIPKLKSDTGEMMAEAVFKALKDWKATEGVVAMCFDTTSSNSGRLNGACTLLEEKLERMLLRLACRHHVYEIYLRAAFEVHFPGTSGPTVAMFDRFKAEWKHIDKSKFEPGIQNIKIRNAINKNKRKEIIDFCKSELKKKILPVTITKNFCI